MISLMAHMIPFYPDEETSREIALAMLGEGAEYLEIQFPFSDPGADGPVIEAACQKALKSGFSVDRGFDFIGSLRERSESLKNNRASLFVMTYASIIFTRGIDSFCREASQRGVRGLIVPDLPLDSDEGLRAAAEAAGLTLVPVLAASSREDRISLAVESRSEFVYCALRKGITGEKTSLGDANIKFLHKAAEGGAKILAGFGISSGDQVKVLQGNAHAAVVGSAFLRAHDQGYKGKIGPNAVKMLIRDLRAGRN